MNKYIAMLLMMTFASCATIQSGNDQIVVIAERTASIGQVTFDTLFRVEKENREQIMKMSPSIHTFVLSLKHDNKAQKYLQTLRAETKAYKENRTPDNKANLQTAISVVQAAINEANKYLSQVP